MGFETYESFTLAQLQNPQRWSLDLDGATGFEDCILLTRVGAAQLRAALYNDCGPEAQGTYNASRPTTSKMQFTLPLSDLVAVGLSPTATSYRYTLTTQGNPLACTITGTAGDDTLPGTSGNDVICGRGGNDVIVGGLGNDFLIGGDGNDTIRGQDGNDSIDGGTGNDSIEGGIGTDNITAGGDNDSIDGGTGADGIDGGAGQDTATYATRTAPVAVTVGDGVANDGELGEGDQIQSGIEVVRGGSGNDALTGDSAANTLLGNNGNDTLSGGDGNDTLQGGAGTNTLSGGNDNDQMDAGTASDIFQGGAGTLDFVDYGARATAVTVTIGAGAADDGAAGEGDDVQGDVERIRGGSAGDTLTGDANDNRLFGGPGADTITGGDGNDRLNGDAGADTINASGDPAFADILRCGADVDTFTVDGADITPDADCP